MVHAGRDGHPRRAARRRRRHRGRRRPRRRWSRPRQGRGLQARRGAGRGLWRQQRRGRDPGGRRCRLVPVRGADRSDRQDGLAEAVPGGRYLRCDPAQGRDAVLGEHRRDQQGRERADLRVLRPRDRRRSQQDPAEADRRDQGQEGLLKLIALPERVSRPRSILRPSSSSAALEPEDDLIEVGVAIVGGGTAGLATANRLLQLLGDDPELLESLGEVPVAVIEKAKTCGGHIMSGAVCGLGRCRTCSQTCRVRNGGSERFAFGEVTKEAVYLVPNAKRAIEGRRHRTSRTTATR